MPAKITQPSKDVKNPYGYTEMDWAAQLDPAYAAARAEVRRLSVGEEGTLSVKVKEFVVMGVLASRGLQYGVVAHMRRAIEYSATEEELFEAIKAAAVLGGGVAYSVGVRALQELEQEGAFPRPSPSSPSRSQRAMPAHPHQRPVGGAKRPHDERRPSHYCEELRLRGKAVCRSLQETPHPRQAYVSQCGAANAAPHWQDCTGNTRSHKMTAP